MSGVDEAAHGADVLPASRLQSKASRFIRADLKAGVRSVRILAATAAVTPGMVIALVCFYSFTIWTVLISMTDSKVLPSYHFAGLIQYRRLVSSGRWWISIENLAAFLTFAIPLSLLGGFTLAIIVHNGKKSALRNVLMIPMSVSFVAAGVAWKWILSPDIGIQAAVRALGWHGFAFDWLVRADRSIYTLVIVSIWQQTGFCMLLFLAGLRGIDREIWNAARLEGVRRFRIHIHIIAPMLRRSVFTGAILMMCAGVKSYDLVLMLTGGGPGFSSDMPARFVMQELMERQEIGLGAAGAVVMLCMVIVAVGPYAYMELARSKPG